MKYFLLLALLFAGCCVTRNSKLGFVTTAATRELSRKEIIDQQLPFKWHTQFERDLICISAIAGQVNLPKGFLTDGASVPRPVWGILSYGDPDILYPAYIHDLLYAARGHLPNVSLTRLQCDQVIREQMLAIGAPIWKANAVFWAVRLGGSNGWDKPRKLARTRMARRP